MTQTLSFEEANNYFAERESNLNEAVDSFYREVEEHAGAVAARSEELARREEVHRQRESRIREALQELVRTSSSSRIETKATCENLMSRISSAMGRLGNAPATFTSASSFGPLSSGNKEPTQGLSAVETSAPTKEKPTSLSREDILAPKNATSPTKVEDIDEDEDENEDARHLNHTSANHRDLDHNETAQSSYTTTPVRDNNNNNVGGGGSSAARSASAGSSKRHDTPKYREGILGEVDAAAVPSAVEELSDSQEEEENEDGTSPSTTPSRRRPDVKVGIEADPNFKPLTKEDTVMSFFREGPVADVKKHLREAEHEKNRQAGIETILKIGEKEAQPFFDRAVHTLVNKAGMPLEQISSYLRRGIPVEQLIAMADEIEGEERGDEEEDEEDHTEDEGDKSASQSPKKAQRQGEDTDASEDEKDQSEESDDEYRHTQPEENPSPTVSNKYSNAQQGQSDQKSDQNEDGEKEEEEEEEDEKHHSVMPSDQPRAAPTQPLNFDDDSDDDEEENSYHSNQHKQSPKRNEVEEKPSSTSPSAKVNGDALNSYSTSSDDDDEHYNDKRGIEESSSPKKEDPVDDDDEEEEERESSDSSSHLYHRPPARHGDIPSPSASSHKGDVNRSTSHPTANSLRASLNRSSNNNVVVDNEKSPTSHYSDAKSPSQSVGRIGASGSLRLSRSSAAGRIPIPQEYADDDHVDHDHDEEDHVNVGDAGTSREESPMKQHMMTKMMMGNQHGYEDNHHKYSDEDEDEDEEDHSQEEDHKVDRLAFDEYGNEVDEEEREDEEENHEDEYEKEDKNESPRSNARNEKMDSQHEAEPAIKNVKGGMMRYDDEEEEDEEEEDEDHVGALPSGQGQQARHVDPSRYQHAAYQHEDDYSSDGVDEEEEDSPERPNPSQLDFADSEPRPSGKPQNVKGGMVNYDSAEDDDEDDEDHVGALPDQGYTNRPQTVQPSSQAQHAMPKVKANEESDEDDDEYGRYSNKNQSQHQSAHHTARANVVPLKLDHLVNEDDGEQVRLSKPQHEAEPAIKNVKGGMMRYDDEEEEDEEEEDEDHVGALPSGQGQQARHVDPSRYQHAAYQHEDDYSSDGVDEEEEDSPERPNPSQLDFADSEPRPSGKPQNVKGGMVNYDSAEDDDEDERRYAQQARSAQPQQVNNNNNNNYNKQRHGTLDFNDSEDEDEEDAKGNHPAPIANKTTAGNTNVGGGGGGVASSGAAYDDDDEDGEDEYDEDEDEYMASLPGQGTTRGAAQPTAAAQHHKEAYARPESRLDYGHGDDDEEEEEDDEEMFLPGHGSGGLGGVLGTRGRPQSAAATRPTFNLDLQRRLARGDVDDTDGTPPISRGGARPSDYYPSQQQQQTQRKPLYSNFDSDEDDF